MTKAKTYALDPLPEGSEFAHLRRVVLRDGRSLVVGAATEATAYVRLGHLTRKYPAADTCLEFYVDTFQVDPAVAAALDVKGGERHGVFARPVPLLDQSAPWVSPEVDEGVKAQLERWPEDLVLVRRFKSQTTATSAAHRMNQALTEDDPFTFLSRTIGVSPRADGAMFGVFARKALT